MSMKSRVILVASVFAILAGASLGQNQPPASNRIVERVGDTGFLELQANSFGQLDSRHQALAYWLTQASIAIDPIIYDQLSRFGLREKRLIEEIVARPSSADPETFKKIRDYALLFWASRGDHNENTGQKFLPAFTFDELQNAALKAQTNGGFKTAYGDLPPLSTPADIRRELTALRPAIFDAVFEP